MVDGLVGFYGPDDTIVIPFFASVSGIITTAPTGTPAWSLHDSDGTVLATGSCSAQAGISGDSNSCGYKASIDLSLSAISSGQNYSVSVTYTVSSILLGRTFRFATV